MGEAFWLANLGGDLSVEGLRAVLEEARKVPSRAKAFTFQTRQNIGNRG
jgi:hypothetical protein